MARRKRRLTPDEAELWRSVAKTTRPLGMKKPEAAPPDRAPVTPQAPARGGPPAKQRAIGPGVPPAVPRPRTADSIDLAPEPLAGAAGAATRMHRRHYERMIRGKLHPEARLDLHGMTREAARAALTRFVLNAQAEGLRLVLVITGKGRPDQSDAVIPERTGILRHALPHWLNSLPLTGRVLEIRPAHQRHGGAGAAYLYLRRRV